MTKNVKCFICKKGWLTIESRSYKSVKFYRISPTCRGRTDETDGGKIKDSVERKKAAFEVSQKEEVQSFECSSEAIRAACIITIFHNG